MCLGARHLWGQDNRQPLGFPRWKGHILLNFSDLPSRFPAVTAGKHFSSLVLNGWPRTAMPPTLHIRLSLCDSNGKHFHQQVSDRAMELRVPPLSPPANDGDVDTLGDPEGFTFAFFVRDASRTPLEGSIRIKQILVKAPLALAPRPEVIVVPLIVPCDASHEFQAIGLIKRAFDWPPVRT
mgnify:CR=1 FL=1